MRNRKNEHGGSLIGVIISGTIFTIIAAASAQMISNQTASVSYLEDRLSSVDLKGALISTLNNAKACENTFQGKKVTRKPITVDQIKDANDDTFIDVTDPRLKSYDRLDLDNISLNINPNVIPASDSGSMKLRVYPKRQRTGSGPVDLSPVEITLAITTDADQKISSCRAYADGSGVGDGSGGLPCGTNPAGSGDYKHGERWKVSSGSNKEQGERAVTTYQNYKCHNGAWLYVGTTNNGCGNCQRPLF